MISPEQPYAQLLLSALFLALVAVLVTRAIRKDRKEYQRFKRLRSTKKRQRMFRKWLVDAVVVFGGASVLVLLLTWQYVPLLLAEIDGYGWVLAARRTFAESEGLGWGLLIGVALAVFGGGLLAIFAARKVETVPTIGDIHALLPRNRAELKYGAALSVNAGVVEELLFRLALPALLYGITGNGVVAVVVSLVLFGMLHIYQGWVGVIGSTIIGAILMAIYLGTGSIVAAIVVHALIDLRSLVLIPVVVYKVHRMPPGRLSERVAAHPAAVDPSPPL